MKQEAGKYSTDAVIYIETREILREKVNGFLLAAILVTAFNTPVEECEEEQVADVSSSEEYYALEVEGIAIKFIED